jgi:hypothetical protein
LNIVLNGCTTVADGYGEITHQLARALAKNNDVSITPNKAWHSTTYMQSDIKGMLNKNLKSVDFELFIFYPNDGLSSRYKTGILSMWEGNLLPSPWINGLNRFGNVFSPSKFVKGVFINSGVKSNVHLLPLGVNTSLYKTTHREFPKNRPFRFLTVGKMEPRKNVSTLVKAFTEEFVGEDIELWIKTRERFLPVEVSSAAKNDPRIKILEKTLGEEELANLYKDCDCFVYPSRAEGFSFPPRNAIATGMPTIVTGWSALSEIKGAVKIPILGLSPMHPCGFSFGEDKGILMADVSPTTLGKVMRDVMNRYDGYAKWTLNNREIPLWEDTAKSLLGTIEELS